MPIVLKTAVLLKLYVLKPPPGYILSGGADLQVSQMRDHYRVGWQNTGVLFERLHQMLHSDGLVKFACYLDSAAANVMHQTR